MPSNSSSSLDLPDSSPEGQSEEPDILSRQQSLLMQQWAHQAQATHNESQLSGDDRILQTGLNNPMGDFHYAQHSNLHHQHSDLQPFPESLSMQGNYQSPLMPMHDLSSPHGTAMNQFGAAASLHSHQAAQYGNMNLNQQEAHANDLLSMMLVASRQPQVSMFTTLLNSNEQGENAQYDTDLHRAYNHHNLAQAIMNNHQQGEHFGASMGQMGPQFPSTGTQHNLQGLRTSNILINNHPGIFNAGQPTVGISNRFHDHASVGVGYQRDMAERIEPTGIGNNSSVGGMLDIQYGLHQTQHQQRLLDLGMGVIKSPYAAEGQKQKVPPKRKKRRPQRKKPTDMPRRPLSAYNLFFSAERERILKEIEAQQSGGAVEADTEKTDADCQALKRPLVPAQAKRRPHRKTHGKISFRDLARMVGARWKALAPDQKLSYQDLADTDMVRHKDAMEAYYKKQAEQKTHEMEDSEEKVAFEESEGKDDEEKVDDTSQNSEAS